MKSAVLVDVGPDSPRLAELLDLLVQLRDGVELEHWGRRLPRWLVERFSEKLPPDEAAAWLAAWRMLPPDEKAAALKERGWTMENWLHWFSSDNEYWALAGYDFDGRGGAMRILVTHDDDPFPHAALDWLIGLFGQEAEEPERLE